MTPLYWLLAGLSIALTVLLAVLVRFFFPRWGLLDRPEQFGYARAPVPYGAGIIFFLVFAGLAIAFLPVDRKLAGVLTAGGLLTAVSFWDDVRNLSPFVRLSVHVLLAGLVVWSGVSITVIRNPFGDVFVLGPVVAAVVTIFWLVLFLNAMNWLDGVPGVTSSVSAVASLVLFLLAVRPDFHVIDQTTVAALSIIVFGMSLAFAFFHLPPPKLLPGDSGSMLLGFLLAVLAIFSGGKLATAFLVLGVPVLDALWSVARRLARGQAPWRGDFLHLHHRLLALGFSERRVVALYVALAALFGGVALFSGTMAKMIAGLALLMIFLVVIGKSSGQRR